MRNTGDTPCLFSYFFICYLIKEIVWSQQIISPYLEKVAFLATETRVDVRKGIRLLTIFALNEIWKMYLTFNYKSTRQGQSVKMSLKVGQMLDLLLKV